MRKLFAGSIAAVATVALIVGLTLRTPAVGANTTYLTLHVPTTTPAGTKVPVVDEDALTNRLNTLGAQGFHVVGEAFGGTVVILEKR